MGVYLRVIIPSANGRISFSSTHDVFTRSSNKMPVAVKTAIKNAAAKVGNMSDEEATDFLCSMERSGRLIEETWN